MSKQKCGPGKKIVSTVVPRAVYDRLREHAITEGISVSAYCARVLTQHYHTGNRLTVYEIPSSSTAIAAESHAVYPEPPHVQPHENQVIYPPENTNPHRDKDGK